MRLGVLASHEGTTFQAILDACGRGAIACRVVHPDPNALDAAIRDTLVRHDVESERALLVGVLGGIAEGRIRL